MSTTLHPVHNNERIILMDALRGIAILGIFIANLGVGFAVYEYTPENTGPFFHPFDKTLEFWQHVFIEGKFYSIFSFLFGWGLAIQLKRSELKTVSPVSFMRRRLTFMLLLGLAHLLLLWSGDIVAFYALVGFVFLWIRKWSDKKLFRTAIICLLLPALLYFLKMNWNVLAAPSFVFFKAGEWIDQKITGTSSFDDFFIKLKNGSYIDQLKGLVAGVFYRYGDLLFQNRFFKVMGMLLLGYLLGHQDRYKTILINKPLLAKVALGGLLVGLPASYLLSFYMNKGGYYQLNRDGMYQTLAYTFGVAPLALGYISVFFLVALTKPGQRLIRLLQPAGKMAFTNYILHSLIGTFVFFGAGLGLMKEVGPVYYTAFAIMVFLLQVMLSTLWLRFFNYGPVEWLWRSATYKKWQPLRKLK